MICFCGFDTNAIRVNNDRWVLAKHLVSHPPCPCGQTNFIIDDPLEERRIGDWVRHLWLLEGAGEDIETHLLFHFLGVIR